MHKQSYDLIVSLGGSCASTKQLRKRNLQFESFPFDWLFHKEESQLSALADGFKTNFNNWLKQENLNPLPEKERGDSKCNQYIDIETGFRYIHDFFQPKENQTQYKQVLDKYKRRYDRLINAIQQSNKILFLLDSTHSIKIEHFQSFLKEMEKLFPKKQFHIMHVYFNPKKEKIDESTKQITIHNIYREKLPTDISTKSKDWNFLDNITLSFRGRFVIQKQLLHIIYNITHISLNKRTVNINLLKILPAIATIKVELLRTGFVLTLGKKYKCKYD